MLSAPCSLAGDDLEVMSEATYDQMSVPRSLFGSRAAYLKEGSPLLLLFADDSPVAGMCEGTQLAQHVPLHEVRASGSHCGAHVVHGLVSMQQSAQELRPGLLSWQYAQGRRQDSRR